MINICYTPDNNYAKYTAVSMLSLLENATTEVLFHIPSNSLSEENKNKFEKIGNIKWYNLKLSIEFKERGSDWTSEATMHRLYLPEIVQEDKLIYLDGDTLVCGDIKRLWDIELEDNYFGSSMHRPAYPEEFYITDYYFNVGVMLMNIKKFRENFTTDTYQTTAKLLYERACELKVKYLSDESILNYLCKDNIKKLEGLHNIYPANIPANKLAELREIQKYYISRQNLIFHWIGPLKPWNDKQQTNNSLKESYETWNYYVNKLKW
jgi:lipopolysaccharide biosynthesis glycosyltransferase